MSTNKNLPEKEIIKESFISRIKKYLNKINEEFYKGITIKKDSWSGRIAGLDEDRYVEIFKNPSKSEFRKLLKDFGYLRFSLEDAFYIWDGDFLHGAVGRQSEVYQGKMFPDKVELYANLLGYMNYDKFYKNEDVNELNENFLSDPDIARLGYTKDQIKWVIESL